MLFQPFRDFEGLPPGPLRERAFARARQKFEVMNRLGTDLMLICSSVHPGAVGGIDRCADDLAELGEIAATYGVRVGYEALAWGRHVNDHRDAWEIVRRADHANVGLILDSYHTMVMKTGWRMRWRRLSCCPTCEEAACLAETGEHDACVGRIHMWACGHVGMAWANRERCVGRMDEAASPG